MKNLILFILFLLLSSQAWATTYYVRDGGAAYGTTSTTCNGTVNIPYTTGNGPNCAVSSPGYLLGYNCTNGGGSCSTTGHITGGDIISIDGDSDTSPGSQAQYEIGQTSPQMPNCTSGSAYDCTMGNMPSGADSSHRTSIIGTGTNKPQLWGTERVWEVINANHNHLLIENLEITDHSDCGLDFFASNFCDHDTYPYGTWAEDGIVLGGDDVILTDVYIHGLGRYGINTVQIASATFTRVYLIANGSGGFTTDSSTTVTGTLTWNQPIVEWNGCLENYPLTQSGIENVLNVTNCTGQGGVSGVGGIVADGIAFGNGGNVASGNWTILGPGSISFNTQDGLDTLHGDGSGVIQIDKMRFEGNGGDSIKIHAQTQSVTNSIVIANCGFFYGQTFTTTNAMLFPDSCRGGGTITYVTKATSGVVSTFFNNTIIGNQDVQMLQSGSCDSTDIFNYKNNITFGGYDWGKDSAIVGGGDNSLITFLFNGGTDGNGAGCSGLTVNEDYNIITGHKSNNTQCTGAHDKCGTDPGFFAGAFPVGTSGGGANTYLQVPSGVTLVPIASNSAAVGAGVNGLTYWNNSNDYYNVTRPNPPSMGAEEVNSCAVNTFQPCFFNTDCCSGSCSVTTNTCSASVGTTDTFSGNLTISGVTFK